MRTWFLCKITYFRETEDGKVNKIKEQYLVDAVSFTEAEARLYQMLSSTVPEFLLTNVSKLNLADLFHYEDAETWFKGKVVYTQTDERSGKEKKIVNQMLVSAVTARDAYDRLQESLSTMLVPFQITDINLTPITDIFPYDAEESALGQLPAADFAQEAAAESAVRSE